MGRHFLLVDDDQGTLDLFSKVIGLNFADVQLTTHICGHDAIKWLEDQNGLDLVISDYCMRGGDGISLAHYCHHRQIPCIIISGYDAEDITPYLPQGVIQMNKIDCMRPNIFADKVNNMLATAGKT